MNLKHPKQQHGPIFIIPRKQIFFAPHCKPFHIFFGLRLALHFTPIKYIGNCKAHYYILFFSVFMSSNRTIVYYLGQKKTNGIQRTD